MGCCLSTNPKKIPKTTPKNPTISKSPPPEEETVKEVLSETRSIPKITPPSPLSNIHANRHYDSPFIKSAPLLLLPNRNSNDHPPPQNGVVSRKPFMAFNGDDNVSEICSTSCESETVSVSTSVTEKRDDRNDVVLRQRSPARRNSKTASFSGEARRDKTVGRSPGRRSEPSPGRARPVPGSGNVKRRDNGESSGRRSRSPAMRSDSGQTRAGSGRSPSKRKTGKSPVRVGSGLGERIRRENGEQKWAPATSDESLENPLVSLECFIFL